MKNKEFYKEDIFNIAIQGYGIALIEGKPVACKGTLCCDCAWSFLNNNDCFDGLRKWAEEEYIEPKDNPFILRPNDVYYCVDCDGRIECAYFHDQSEFDKCTVKFGNACKDEEYMNKRAKEIRLYNLLSNFAYQVNEGWEPDWNSETKYQWYIYYDTKRNAWDVKFEVTCMNLNTVYFKSKELAERAINEVIIPFENE